MTVKRSCFSEDGEEVKSLAMANCLMLLSRVGHTPTTSTPGRVFECKTCKRQFSSFQALGGHRASHKKPKLMQVDDLLRPYSTSPLVGKPKTHDCSICGVEFAIGQALGGHMRRHRGVLASRSSEATDDDAAKAVPVLKKSNSSKRVLCLDLDLNLTPFENGLKLGTMGPLMFHRFI